MLVLNKHAAMDHLIARAIRQSEVVPEPFAAHVATPTESDDTGLDWTATALRDALAQAPELEVAATGLHQPLRYTAAASGSGAVR
ncbi:MAG: hypothetical protein M3P30_14465 [Chloroflexota bacterium]|nr:hypothetical protein [Chloroflexota bacterium]